MALPTFYRQALRACRALARQHPAPEQAAASSSATHAKRRHRGPFGSERRNLMRLHGIRFNGRNFEFLSYRYENLADAIAYAQQIRPQDRPADLAHGIRVENVEVPTPEQKQLMRSWSVSYRRGYYHLGPYRYERLSDAIAYAKFHDSTRS